MIVERFKLGRGTSIVGIVMIFLIAAVSIFWIGVTSLRSVGTPMPWEKN
jgi:hypothetical protein